MFKSLIFVDPDIGLQSKSPNEKHILYWEVGYLYDQMDKDSLLMVYQHSIRKSRKQFFNQIKEKLEVNLNASPLCIFSGDVAFFFLSKNRTFKEDLHGILKEYTMKYPDLEVI